MEMHCRVVSDTVEVRAIDPDCVVELGPMGHAIGKIAVGHNVFPGPSQASWRHRRRSFHDLHIVNIDAVVDVCPEG